MRLRSYALVTVATIALLGCGGGGTGIPGPGNGGGNGGNGNGNEPTPPPPNADVVVDIIDDAFVDPQGRQNQQASVTIDLGETVGWTHNGNNLHTVTADDVPDGATRFASPQMARGETFTVTPDVAGTYSYFCEVHPGIMLNATIVVVE